MKKRAKTRTGKLRTRPKTRAISVEPPEKRELPGPPGAVEPSERGPENGGRHDAPESSERIGESTDIERASDDERDTDVEHGP